MILFIILIFLLLFLLILFMKPKIERMILPTKILHLVLFSHDNGGPYDMMREKTRTYYSLFPNIKTYYYCFHDGQMEQKGDILYFQGKEGYIPEILDKTIKSFEYFKDYDYDYIVRSNISSVINFNELYNILPYKNPNIYGGAKNLLNSISKQYGIVDNKYFGLNYISGTCIILSKYIVEQIIENKNSLDYSVIDDVAIGIFINKYLPNTEILDLVNYFKVNDSLKNLLKEPNMNLPIIYRHRTNDRYFDVKMIDQLIKELSSQSN